MITQKLTQFKCPLCSSLQIQSFEKDYFSCHSCGVIFKDPLQHISLKEEFYRYELHENDLQDEKYRQYLAKLLSPIENKIEKNWKHLDFGSGRASVYQYLLKDRLDVSHCYDIFFYPDRSVLEIEYDLVTCSEVVEHFRRPLEEWELLVSTVKKGGLLAVMTQLYDPSKIDFKSWWYKNDKTHLVFYRTETFDYLEKKFNLKIVFNDAKSILVFRRCEDKGE